MVDNSVDTIGTAGILPARKILNSFLKESAEG
jgi:hypothetical protein